MVIGKTTDETKQPRMLGSLGSTCQCGTQNPKNKALKARLKDPQLCVAINEDLRYTCTVDVTVHFSFGNTRIGGNGTYRIAIDGAHHRFDHLLVHSDCGAPACGIVGPAVGGRFGVTHPSKPL
eukprot:9055333-Pyramimonas_sp.AAC.2